MFTQLATSSLNRPDTSKPSDDTLIIRTPDGNIIRGHKLFPPNSTPKALNRLASGGSNEQVAARRLKVIEVAV
jgi:hypothetical protein